MSAGVAGKKNAAFARGVLTRERGLLRRRNAQHGCYLKALKAGAQLKEMVERLELAAHTRPFNSCLSCDPRFASGNGGDLAVVEIAMCCLAVAK